MPAASANGPGLGSSQVLASEVVASRTAYEGLSPAKAVGLAKSTFGVQQPTWTAPWVAAHGRLEGFLNDYVAEVSLPSQPHVLIQSSAPLRVRAGSRMVPLSLGLEPGDGGYVPAAGVVPLVISKSAAGGVALPGGLGVRPQGVSDVPGVVVGNRLLYANVAADTDFMAAPTPRGVEVSWQLRSARSSADQSLRFSLPGADVLAISKTVPGGAVVLSNGLPRLEVMPAIATDAAGHSLPVSYAVAGDVLQVHVSVTPDTEYPVLVDPDVMYSFPTTNGAQYPNWYMSVGGNTLPASEVGGPEWDAGYCLSENPLTIADNGDYPSCNAGPAAAGTDAEWYFTSFDYVPGTVRIYRADVANFIQSASAQSYFTLGITGDEYAPLGPDPVYTWNGDAGAMGAEPLQGQGPDINAGVAFCAQSGGGADNSSVPLCSDNYEAPYASGGDNFVMQLASNGGPVPSAYDAIEMSNVVNIDETDVTPPTVDAAAVNDIAVSPPGATFWSRFGKFTVQSEDDGAGVLGTDLYVQPGYNNGVQGGGWPPASPAPSQSVAGSCDGAAQPDMCDQYSNGGIILKSGTWTVTALPWNPFGLSRAFIYHVGVDNSAPQVSTSGSFPAAVSAGTIADGSYQMTVTAQDGSSSAPQSGVAKISATLDGQPLDQGTYSNSGCPAGTSAPSTGEPPPSACQNETISLPINTAILGEGGHTLVLTATDWAGNVSTGTTTFIVKHAAQTAVGPGSLNLRDGDYTVQQPDVSVADFAGALRVSRTYTSMPSGPLIGPNGGGRGSLGPGWALNLPASAGAGDFQSLAIVGGVATLTGENGTNTTFTPSSSGSSFQPPPDLAGWTLSGAVSGPSAGLCGAGQNGYELTDPEGDVTTFAPAAGSTLYMPCAEASPTQGGAGNVTSVLYEASPDNMGIVPQMVLAPVPAGVSCSVSSMVAGCRALEFKYATTTTASGTAPADWGSYTGQLSEIDFVAYDPQSSQMTTRAVAEYSYDNTGALRAEWDPRKGLLVRTTYSYNGQGLLSTLTPPGLAPWSFTYSSTTSGQLLSVTRQDPKLSTPSTWTVSYNVPLSGAGAPYPMGPSDVSAWAQADDPASATAIFPPDEVPASSPPPDYNRATIYYLDTDGRQVNVAAPGGAITTTEYDATDNPIRTLSAANRALALAAGSNAAAQSQLLDTENTYNTGGDGAAGTELLATLGPQHTIYVPSASGGAPTAYTGRTDWQYTYDQGAPSSGGPYTLVTTETQGAEISGQSEDLDVKQTTTSYSGQNGLGWTLREPTSVTIQDPNSSAALTTTTTYDPTTGLPLSTTSPDGTASDQTINYSAAANASYPACGGHPESANLPCQEMPAVPQGPTFVQEVTAHASVVASATVKPLEPITVGDRMIVEVGIWGNSSPKPTAASVTDSAGNTYTELLHFHAAEGTEMSVWSAPITAGGGTAPTITVTPTASADNADIGVAAMEYAGLSTAAGTGALDTDAYATGTTTTAATVASGPTSTATGGPNELALGFYADSGFEDALTSGSGFTQRANVSPTGNMEFVAEDQIVGEGTTPNATVGTGANTTWLMATLVFKPSSLPSTPVSNDQYNIWEEPTTATGTGGGATRVITDTYDAAARLASSAVQTQSGPQIPTVTYGYDPNTGLQTTESANGATITTAYDTLGRFSAYTDADGNTSTDSYDIDGRLSSFNDGKGTQTYGYDPTTGYLTSLTDSSIGSTPFTATYNADGAMTSELYANGMTAQYTYDPAGQPTNLSYVKTSNCSTNCTWYQDAVEDSAAGQSLQENTTLGDSTYTYDYAGRLTKAQDVTGQGASATCTTNAYSYDADSNRTSLTTTPPGANGSCGTTGATVQTHSYDDADRPTDGGIAYDAFGDITALSAADAGGQALTSAYYSDGTTQSLTQGGLTVTNNLDPDGRTRQQVTSGSSSATVTMHYNGSGDSPAWTVDGSGNTTRYIDGIDGGLAAVQVNSTAPVLQIQDLEGDIVGQASLNATATALLSTSSSNEYGVPTTSSPNKYGWLGADQRETEFPSGIVAMGARTYIPQAGIFLQPDPVPGGSANPYGYANGDPVNNTDLSGDWVDEAWVGPAPGWAGTTSLATIAAQAAAIAQTGAAANADGEWQSYEDAENGTGFAGGGDNGEGEPSGGGGGGGGGGAGASEPNITFGHGARHLQGTGLSQGDVESAITRQIRQQVSRAGGSTGQFWGRVEVDGKTIEYRAYTLPNGTINVGTYHEPKN